MTALLRHFSPYGLISPNHPLFKLELPRIRRLLDPRALVRFSLRVGFIIFVIFSVFWLLAVNSDNQHLSRFRTAVNEVMILMLLVSLGMNAILDFACMVATAGSFTGDFAAGRWDLLRITPLTAEDIAAVKHVAARLRVWRMTMIVFALRLAILILGILTWLMHDGLADVQLNVENLFSYAAVLLIGATYLVEPLWRARAITALGIAISFRLRSNLSISLAAIGSILALWILLPLIIIGILWGIWAALIPILSSSTDASVGFILVFLSAIYIIVMVNRLYGLVQHSAMNRLIRWINRSEA